MSNLIETLLEGNKDHLLNRARTDLARREIHVESLNKCINDSQKKRRHKTGYHRLQEELLRKEKALRDTQIRSMHEMGIMKRAQEQQG